MLEKVVFQASLRSDAITTRMHDSFRVIGSVFNQLLLDTSLEEVALQEYTTTLERFNGYAGYKGLSQIEKYYPEITSIKLYTYNHTLIENSHFVPITSDFYSKEWFTHVLDSNGKLTWIYDTINGNAPSYHLLYELRGPSTYKKIGVLSIEMNKNYPSSFIEKEFFDTFILVPSGQVIASNAGPGVELPYIQKQELKNILDFEPGLYDAVYKGENGKALISSQKVDYLNTSLTLVTIIPDSFITQDTVSWAFPFLLVVIISCSLSIWLIVFFTNTISSRMSKLSFAMERIAKGDFDVSLQIGGADEISTLYTNLDQMRENIRALIEKVYVSNLHQKELLLDQKELLLYQKDMQLKMLLYQVNPHFLFNTLEAIRMSAHTQNNTELADIIESLAFMLRSTLDTKQEFVFLSDEMALLENYLKIMHFRLGSRITYEFTIPDELLHAYVPYFILQPLVENAITHGLESKLEGGHIEIYGTFTKQGFSLVVEDNGMGMDELKLQEVLASLHLSTPPSKHIGLLNIHQRLQMIYGKAYGLSLFSQKEKGTRVEISLPLYYDGTYYNDTFSMRKEL